MNGTHTLAALPRAATAARWPVRLAAVLLAGLAPAAAQAVLFYSNNNGGPRFVTLRVGSANAAINNVRFTVDNAAVAPNPVPVAGVAGGGATGGTPATGIRVEITARRRGVVRLLVDSSLGMSCIGGGCGATIIPFTTVSWVSNELATGGTAGLDIQSGSFNGSAAQQILSVNVPAGSTGFTVRNTLVFTYANSTLYPSGNYSGRVTFTAVAP